MPMERMTVTMAASDIDNFERGRASVGMSKSAYIRFLISEHENNVPEFIYNREIIDKISQLDADIKQLILKEMVSDADKLILYEKLKELKEILRNQA